MHAEETTESAWHVMSQHQQPLPVLLMPLMGALLPGSHAELQTHRLLRQLMLLGLLQSALRCLQHSIQVPVLVAVMQHWGMLETCMQNLRQLDAERAQLLRAEASWAAELLPVSELSQAELPESELLEVYVPSPPELQLLESELTDVHMPLPPESELLEHRMKAPDLALCWHDCWADMDLAFGQGPAMSCGCDWGWVAGGLGDGCQGQALG